MNSRQKFLNVETLHQLMNFCRKSRGVEIHVQPYTVFKALTVTITHCI